ncbi:cytochrome P450 [Streptomyces jumonjinensis]|uniref:cytochrome P450 n=1 Tax=Streptomyces jumonjinensis TaxID=1945 RepID=UPI00379942A1
MSTVIPIAAPPRGMPLLGHALSLLRDPLGVITALPAQGDLVRLRLGPREIVVVCDPLLTRQVLMDDRTFDKGGALFERAAEVLGDGMVTCPHARHRRQRRLAQPSFHPSRVSGFGEVMADEFDAASRSWHDGQITDMSSELATLTLRVAVRTMFSAALPPDAVRGLVTDFSYLVESAMRRTLAPRSLTRIPTPGNRRYERARLRCRRVVGDLIAERRADGRDHGDLLSSLLLAQDPNSAEGPAAMSDQEVSDQVLTFFFAGSETVAGMLVWALSLLARHPDVEARLHTEVDAVLAGAPATTADVPRLELTGRIVSETLRLHPPAWLLSRVVTRDTELGGVPMPAGTEIGFSPYLIHRRPDLYRDPDAFDPDRWLGTPPARAAYIPFSSGARMCIGDRFALLEAALALAAITSRWSLRQLTPHNPRPSMKGMLSPNEMRMRIVARPRADGGGR